VLAVLEADLGVEARDRRAHQADRVRAVPADRHRIRDDVAIGLDAVVDELRHAPPDTEIIPPGPTAYDECRGRAIA
jgi:hypothetical protein